MAGGPHAAIVMCMLCTGKAVRVHEGLEDDQYGCEDCGQRFGIDWSRGAPKAPCWPPSPEDLAMAKKIIELQGGTDPKRRG